jgi:hypothetical protein
VLETWGTTIWDDEAGSDIVVAERLDSTLSRVLGLLGVGLNLCGSATPASRVSYGNSEAFGRPDHDVSRPGVRNEDMKKGREAFKAVC